MKNKLNLSQRIHRWMYHYVQECCQELLELFNVN